jgi:hypothetical protein
MHIALDDGNLSDSHLDFCFHEAARDECAECMDAAAILRQMTRTQRRKVVACTHAVTAASRA